MIKRPPYNFILKEMEPGEFKSQIKEAFKIYEGLTIKQERRPGDENCDAMTKSFNGIMQMVMDEVGSREDWEAKLKVIQSFEEVVEKEYGISKNVPMILIRQLHERMLLQSWGVDNPHDPFHRYDGQK